MDISAIKPAFLLVTVGILAAAWLWFEWAEKGLASPLDEATISPDGCYRLEALKPFWLLPDVLHPQSHPDEEIGRKWFQHWGNPAFFRLYDQRSGRLISETKIYDLESAGGQIFWGRGSGTIMIGNVHVGDILADCKGGNP